MCNLGEVIARENTEKGMEKGREENLLSNLKNLIKNTGWPLEQALATLEIPREEWGRYVEMLTSK